MDKDRLVGMALLPVSLAGIAIYFWLIFFVAPLLVVQITAFVAVAVVLVIVAWIAYALATTPRSKSIEEIERELEEELKRVQVKEQGEGKREPASSSQ